MHLEFLSQLIKSQLVLILLYTIIYKYLREQKIFFWLICHMYHFSFAERDMRMNKHGEPLPSARKVRTTLQTTGRVEDRKVFTAAVPIMLEFIHRDVSLLNGPSKIHFF